MLEVLKPQYSFVPTNDELLVSLCMDKQAKIEMQAYFFKHSGNVVRPPEYSRGLLTLAVPSDKADILDNENVAENIALGKYYVMRENGVFLGQGFFNRHTLIANAASIGMSVHPDFRQRGIGRSIIMHLADICREKGLTPYCGCWYYNYNSKATLESAGFVTQTRLLKVWFSQ
jgi:GNAT superfamily N-acetyltransferase